MSNNSFSHAGKIAPSHQNLTPNERAIIDNIRIPILRNIFTSIWQTKLRLQFTGWLQYVPPLVVTLVIFLSAGIVHLLGGRQVANGFAFVGYLLLAVEAFDLVTVKFRLRPREHRPKRNDDLELFDLMRARRSCRSFQTRKLASIDYNELMESVHRHSAEPRIGKSQVRFEYISAPLTVWPTVNASEFLVAIAPLEYDRLAVMDVGRSLQKIVMDATRMGLGTCWIGPGADHKSIVQHLGDRFDPKKDHIICVCAVGYKSWFIPMFIRAFNAQVSSRRLPLSALFFADPQMKEPLDLDAYPFNRLGRTYEICQWAPSSYNGQTTRCVAVTEKNGKDGDARLTRFDFYSNTASRYYAPVAAGIWCANWEIGCESLGINGHFALLSTDDRCVQEKQDQLPRYDVSWILDENL
jgi:Putative TM nitroreductase